MVDVILVLTKKGSGDEQCSDVHNNIDVESAKIDSIPTTGNNVFYVIKDGESHKKCTFLRIYSKMERVNHYDHVIFAEVSKDGESSGDCRGIMAFSGTYPKPVEEDEKEKLHEYYKKNEDFVKFIDKHEYGYIKVPVGGGEGGGGNDYYHIFCILMVEYNCDGQIIEYKIIAFAVISNDGQVFIPVKTIGDAKEKVEELIAAAFSTPTW
jgi:hypothetical protein